MKFSCYLCLANLVILGIFGGVLSFTGFDLLLFLCFGNLTFKRIYLAICLVCALFTVYSLVVFKPFKGLK